MRWGDELSQRGRTADTVQMESRLLPNSVPGYDVASLRQKLNDLILLLLSNRRTGNREDGLEEVRLHIFKLSGHFEDNCYEVKDEMMELKVKTVVDEMWCYVL